MPKIVITPELYNTIKTIRQQNKIKSKDLADHLSKSPAYITKLEKGEIKTIDSELLDDILGYIVIDNNEGTEIAQRLLNSLKLKYSKKEIEEQIWFLNYDTVYRNIPIPPQVIDEINNRINQLQISRDYLLKRINANEALSQDEVLDSSTEYNEWYSSKDNTSHSIKIHLNENELNNILDKKTDSTAYVKVYCIVFYLLKIAQCCAQVLISSEDNSKLMQEATEFLNSYKFYSLLEKDKLISCLETKEQSQALLSTFDNENINVISDILSGYKYVSEIDIKIANERLRKYNENMHWDIWFMMKLTSMDFASLSQVNIETKRELLKEIASLIEKYRNVPPKKDSIETY